MKIATYVGDPSNDGEGKPRLVMKKGFVIGKDGEKIKLFPATGKVFKMNVEEEVTDAQHAFLAGHSHFTVDPPLDSEATEEDEDPNPEEGEED